MNTMYFDDNIKDYNLDLHCPGCGHLVRGLIESGPIFHKDETSDVTAYLICRCPRHVCNSIVFAKYDRFNKRISAVFPYPKSLASDYLICLDKYQMLL